MSDESEYEEDDAPFVPEGATLFPEIPAELGVDPLLLVAIHATSFLLGSTKEIVNAEAADEVVSQIAVYLQRLPAERLPRLEEDIATLIGYGRREKWPRQLIQTLKYYLADMEVVESSGDDGEDE